MTDGSPLPLLSCFCTVSTVKGSPWKESTPSPDPSARLIDWLELQRLWTDWNVAGLVPN